MKRETWVLASGSPRRIEMFRQHGLEVEVMPADVDESLREGIRATDAVMFLALKKALYTERRLLEGREGEFASLYEGEAPVIVAADTVVAYEEEILGKPESPQEAYEMLSKLNGATHYVATGVAVIRAGTYAKKVFCERSDVTFVTYTDQDIWDYIHTGEPMDKAGAYAIQGGFGKYVKKVQGSRANIIGFPWERFVEEMED